MPKASFGPELLVQMSAAKPGSLRLQLERELRGAIEDGRLTPGAALPSSRLLANDLGLSRGLVVSAYEQLIAEGYLVSKQGSATRVSRGRTAANQDRIGSIKLRAAAVAYDFTVGVPDVSLFPKKPWLAAMRRAIDSVGPNRFSTLIRRENSQPGRRWSST